MDKGYTIVYVPWDDLDGKTRVLGRYETEEEKDIALSEIYEDGSGWLEEELQMVTVINDYNHRLEY